MWYVYCPCSTWKYSYSFGSGSRLFVNPPDPDPHPCLWKNWNNFILVPPKRVFRLQDKPSAPPKRTSNTSKHEISWLFFFFAGYFYFLELGSYLEPDPALKHWKKGAKNWILFWKIKHKWRICIYIQLTVKYSTACT